LFFTFYAAVIGSAHRPETANRNPFPLARESDLVVRVISYNIRGDSRTDRAQGNSWDVRKSSIKTLISSYQPDIMGLQEVSTCYMPDLHDLFPEYTIVTFDLNEKNKDAALLMRTERFAVLNTNFFWVSEQPLHSKTPAWDSRVPRIVIYAHIRDRWTQKECFVFCTHFDSTGVQARLEGAKLLNQQQKIIAGDLPVIVIGDFNVMGATAEKVYQNLLGENKLFDIRDLSAYHYGPDGTWIGWPYDPEAVPAGTVGSRLDHIVVRQCNVLQEGVLHWKVNNGDLIAEMHPAYSQMLYPSDHLPLIADIMMQ